MIVADAHQTIASDALVHGWDYMQHPWARMHSAPRTVGLPDAILGRVALVLAAIVVIESRRVHPDDMPVAAYYDAQSAYTAALRQLDYYQRLADHTPQIALIRSLAELDNVLLTWTVDTPLNRRVQGLVMCLNGADPIIEPRQFEEWYERGVRCVALTWHGTRYSGGAGTTHGLSGMGRELLAVLADYNVMVDLANSSEKAFFETLDMFEGVVIVSHANPRAFVDHERQLSDGMLRRLAERGGVVGVVMQNQRLSRSWAPGVRSSKIPVSHVADVIDYICQLTGSSAHVGIGSGLGGPYRPGAAPEGIDTAGDLLKLGHVLAARGYAPADVEAILVGNFVRQLRAALT